MGHDYRSYSYRQLEGIRFVACVADYNISQRIDADRSDDPKARWALGTQASCGKIMSVSSIAAAKIAPALKICEH